MNTEQLKGFGEVVSAVNVSETGFTKNIPTFLDGVDVNTWKPTMDTDKVWLNIKVGGGNTVGACLTVDQCMKVAASLMAQAMRIIDAKDMPADFDASAHGHLLTERAPVDDEQP